MYDFLKDMTEQEREEFMDGMTISDSRHDYYKTNERPLTLRESILEYQEKHRMQEW